MKRIIYIVSIVMIISSLFMGSVCAEPASAVKFKDIKSSDWFAEAVDRMATLGIIDGVPGGAFDPKGEVTRAQFVKMLVQAMEYKKTDSISFDDIKPLPTRKAHWASVYIETALRNGVIVKDEIGSNFYPDVPVTRKDMFIMLYRALKLEESTGENPFTDIAEPNGCFTKLYEEYLVGGTVESGKRLFRPEGLTTRAEAAVVIARMLDYKENPEGFVARMKAEEDYKDLVARIKAGTYTEEDLAHKAKLELAKQAEDKEYIPEPIIKYDYDSFVGLHLRGTLVNEKDYTNDTLFSVVCTNYPDLNKQAHGTSRGGFVETDSTRLIDANAAGVVLINIPVYDAKQVNGKVEYYKYDLNKGSKVNYVLTISKGKITKKINITVAIQ